MKQSHDRMRVLADSLPGTVRWRFCDYEQLLKKELQLLAAAPRLSRFSRGHQQPRFR